MRKQIKLPLQVVSNFSPDVKQLDSLSEDYLTICFILITFNNDGGKRFYTVNQRVDNSYEIIYLNTTYRYLNPFRTLVADNIRKLLKHVLDCNCKVQIFSNMQHFIDYKGQLDN